MEVPVMPIELTPLLFAGLLVLSLLVGLAGALAGRQMRPRATVPAPTTEPQTKPPAQVTATAPLETPTLPQAPAVSTDMRRILRIPAESLAEVWPELSPHMEMWPDAGALLRDIGAGRASLWVAFDFTGPRCDVLGVLIAGVLDDAVCTRAVSAGFVDAYPEFANLALLCEAVRTGCYRCAIKQADAIAAYNLAIRWNAFLPQRLFAEQRTAVQ
jgi:hypothetical protein